MGMHYSKIDTALKNLSAEDRIAALICSLVGRDTNSIRTILALLGTVSVMAQAMSDMNRYECANTIRDIADEIERLPQRSVC